MNVVERLGDEYDPSHCVKVFSAAVFPRLAPPKGEFSACPVGIVKL